jgi:hypothetical protein
MQTACNENYINLMPRKNQDDSRKRFRTELVPQQDTRKWLRVQVMDTHGGTHL